MRTKSGSTLVLIMAILMGIVLALAFFGLSFGRIIGSQQEQKTAIEAAALAGARAVSMIIVEEPELGFVGLSDAGPFGRNIAAEDNYGLPVHGINSLLATVRLDLIIADQVNSPIMKQFAQQDYAQVAIARDHLVTEIKEALDGREVYDRDGKVINPIRAAEEAYKSNSVRMQGGSSELVAGSLKLTLGCIDEAPTNQPAAMPIGLSSTDETQQEGGFYKGNVNVPYGDRDFVFAALGKSVILVDHLKFRERISGVPYCIPTVVLATGDQKFEQTSGNGERTTRTIHCAASAQAFDSKDPQPAPGALCIGFPDGSIDEIVNAGQFFTDPGMSTAPMNLYSAQSGDYPASGARLVPYTTHQVLGSRPTVSAVWARSLYDWLRRGGANIRIDAVTSMLNTALSPGVAKEVGFMTVFTFTTGGGIDKKQLKMDNVYIPSSSQQLCAITTTKKIASNGTAYIYDLLVCDQVFRQSKMRGGKHAGEPLEDPRLRNNPPVASDSSPTEIPPGAILPPPRPKTGWGGKAGGWAYGIWMMLGAPGPYGGHNRPEAIFYPANATTQGELRKTYKTNGCAVDFTFHKLLIKKLGDQN